VTGGQADAPTTIRQARHGDGGAIWEVVRDSGTLDVNTSYAYMLLAAHFGDTCAIAERDGRPVGMATGYQVPGRPDAVFLWQIGMRPEAQGQGLGKRLIQHFLWLPGALNSNRLETTITVANAASRALFQSVAKALNTNCHVSPFFTEELFPDPGHEAEELFEIGPFDRTRISHIA